MKSSAAKTRAFIVVFPESLSRSDLIFHHQSEAIGLDLLTKAVPSTFSGSDELQTGPPLHFNQKSYSFHGKVYKKPEIVYIWN